MEYSPWAQTPCIMFVDHHQDLRQCVKDILELEGYKVLTARNSIEALVMAADYPHAIDVLVSEAESRVYQNGLELAACFGILRPETRILLTTEPGAEGEVSLGGNTALDWEGLPKPFTKKQLVAAVTRAVDLDWRQPLAA